MIIRVKQFGWALWATVSDEEKALVAQVLQPAEQEFFYRMSIVDQRHALDVYYLVEEYLKTVQVKDGDEADRKNLVKAALLHDIGKKDGELTLFDRSLVVIVQALMPKLLHRWAKEGQGGFLKNRRHAIYVALHHGERGAKDLEEAGCSPEILQLIAEHHKPATTSWLMAVLKDTDSKS